MLPIDDTRDSRDNRLGTTIENYRLLSVLGTGSTSVVYLGQRLDDPRALVAVKVLRYHASTEAAEQASFRMRFLREARAASKLRHEHILPVLSFGDADGVTFMVMPVIVGGTLGTRLADGRGPLSLQEIAAYLKQLASALDAAHARGVVHRDIKPSNVLLDEHGHLYLTDFGIARLFDSGDGALTREAPATLTHTGQVLGTPYYMAPEQIRGEPVGPSADIYATGIMLYQLVTGQVPFHGDTPLAVALQHLQETPASPGLLRDDLPEPIESVIMRAIAKDPNDRFASAGALAEAFSAGLVALGPDADVESRSSAWRFATGLSEGAIAPADSVPSGASEEAFDALYDHLVGTQIGGYQLEHLITCTEHDAIFLARQAGATTPYRLCVVALSSELSDAERATYFGWFQERAHALAELQHPNILSLYDYGVDDGVPYLVAADVAGQSLTELLGSGGQLDFATIASDLDQIATALGFAHQQGILHLGLSTDCVYVRDGTDVVVADFGLCELLHAAAPDAVNGSMREGGTKDGGTERERAPLYIAHRVGCCAPEQLQGKPVGEYTDVYGLGAVLYQLLTGHPVFSGAMADDVAQQHLYSTIPPLRTWRAGLPAGLENIVARSLSKEPEHRFRRASDLASAYRRVVARPGVDMSTLPSPSVSRDFKTGTTASGSTAVAAVSTQITRPTSPQPSAVAVAALTRPPTTALDAATQAPVAAGAAPPPTSAASLAPQPSQPTLLQEGPAEQPTARFSRVLQRLPVVRQVRRPWLTAIALLLVVALLAASVTWVIRARASTQGSTSTAGQASTLTGCVAIAGLGDAAGVRFFDHVTGDGLTDEMSTCLKGLPMPADGYQYYGWLIDTHSEHVTALGPLAQKDGGWSLDYSTGSSHGGVDLLGLGDKVAITPERGPLQAPADPPVIVAQFPSDSFVHIKHLLVAFETTPAHQGLLVGLQQQAQALDLQAHVLQGYIQRGGFPKSLHCTAQNVVNILEGSSGPNYRSLGPDCGAGGIVEVDDGFGLLGTNGYLAGVADHAALAATAPHATQHIKIHGHDVVTAVGNMQTWAQTVHQDALSVLLQDNHDLGNAAQIATLATYIISGTDTNGDGSVDDVPGEAGLFNAYTHGQLMAFLPFGPMGQMGNGM